MRIKLIKSPHLGQNSMLCHTAARTFELSVGSSKDVSDIEGHTLSHLWPGCFEIVALTTPADERRSAPRAPAKEPASIEDLASIEATKMVTKYPNKQLGLR